MMCSPLCRIARATAIPDAAPAVIASHSANLCALKHRSIPLVALLSVMLLAGCADRELYKTVTGQTVIWDVDTGKARHNIRGFRRLCDLAIFPDGRTLLVAKGMGSGGPFTHPGENAVVLYDVATGKKSRQLAKFSREKPVSKVALTPDGRFVLAVVGKGDIYRWKLEDR